jgi:3-oxoacyl-(acyl-carrier-protein) synthase
VDTLRERGPDRVAPTFIQNVLVDAASGQLAIATGFRGPN